MMKSAQCFATLATVALTSTVALAESHSMMNPMVGGSKMFPQMNIVENTANSADHTTLVTAVQAAGQVETLASEGPFTVFTPTNDAFGMLASRTLDPLLEPENKEALVQVLTCHVMAAEVFSDALVSMIEDDGGAEAIPTVGGCTSIGMVEDGMVKIQDDRGRAATVTIADVDQSNGVIHVIDTVLLPAM